MAEDGIVGWAWFDFDTQLKIANQAAVEQSGKHLVNETAFDAAFDNLRASSAFEAVNEAAEMKASRLVDRPVHDAAGDCVQEFLEGSDYFPLC